MNRQNRSSNDPGFHIRLPFSETGGDWVRYNISESIDGGPVATIHITLLYPFIDTQINLGRSDFAGGWWEDELSGKTLEYMYVISEQLKSTNWQAHGFAKPNCEQ